MRVLGIDYGTKRIGLALSDESGRFAFPLKVISQLSISDTNSWIKRICEEKKVSKIVLGRPIGYKGDARKILEKIEKFKIRIEKEIGLPVVYENEVLTTQEAKRPLLVGRPRGKLSNYRGLPAGQAGSTSIVDASAAALILQSYLDKKEQLC